MNPKIVDMESRLGRVLAEFEARVDAKRQAERRAAEAGPHKVCTACGDKKPLCDFHVRRRSADGRTASCRVCNCRAFKARYHGDPGFHRSRALYRTMSRLRQRDRDAYRRWIQFARNANDVAAENGRPPVYDVGGVVGRDLASHDACTSIAARPF